MGKLPRPSGVKRLSAPRWVFSVRHHVDTATRLALVDRQHQEFRLRTAADHLAVFGVDVFERLVTCRASRTLPIGLRTQTHSIRIVGTDRSWSPARMTKVCGSRVIFLETLDFARI